MNKNIIDIPEITLRQLAYRIQDYKYEAQRILFIQIEYGCTQGEAKRIIKRIENVIRIMNIA